MERRTWTGSKCPKCGRASMERADTCTGRFRNGSRIWHDPTAMEPFTMEVSDEPYPARWPSQR